MSTPSLQTSRYNPRSFLYFFAGSLTVILVYVLVGHLPQRQSSPALGTSHSDVASGGNWHSSAEEGTADTEQDGWFTSEKDNPYGTGVDVSGYLTPEQQAASAENMKLEHIELNSQMTKDGKWFTIDLLTQEAFNPGFLPSPDKPDVWIIFAQRDKSKDNDDLWNSELVCEATYHAASQTMRCIEPPIILPISSTITDKCVGEYDFMKDMVGPHDARIFYGPDRPYIIYGSQSPRSCLGQYIHDLRRLTPFWYNRTTGSVTDQKDDFFWPTDLQRPPPYSTIEKNWFTFWDTNNQMYLHYDIKSTKRSFAKLNSDGSVGQDLASLATSDTKCMNDLMPSIHHNDQEWIHQATNSLSITLCKRAECQPTDANTFNMVLFQTKTFYSHGVYEPYVMLFKRSAPFQVHGVSSKPLWYNGRGKAGEYWRWSTWKPKDQTQLVFTTQMAWQGGAMYHGYLDDNIMIAFGIEDKHAGGIDVAAEDLLQGVKYCGDDT